jgi:hypothetical protein
LAEARDLATIAARLGGVARFIAQPISFVALRIIVLLVQKTWSLKRSIRSDFSSRRGEAGLDAEISTGRLVPWAVLDHMTRDAFAKLREKTSRAKPVGIGT